MTHPHYQAWNVLIETEAGERVSLAALFANFTRPALAAWYRQSALNVGDQYGVHPEAAEAFIESRIAAERSDG
jgi:hypothetical protein